MANIPELYEAAVEKEPEIGRGEPPKVDERCNLCGLSCNLVGRDGRPRGLHGLVKEVVSGGYDSTAGNGYGALDDVTAYKFSLCEFCLDWLFQQFRIPVEVFNFLSSRDDEPPVFRPAAQRVTEDEWREDKEYFFEEYERRNAARGMGVKYTTGREDAPMVSWDRKEGEGCTTCAAASECWPTDEEVAAHRGSWCGLWTPSETK